MKNIRNHDGYLNLMITTKIKFLFILKIYHQCTIFEFICSAVMNKTYIKFQCYIFLHVRHISCGVLQSSKKYQYIFASRSTQRRGKVISKINERIINVSSHKNN